MLKKREDFRAAYAGFDVDRVAAFGSADRDRLIADAGIVRNRLKVEAAIANAGVVRRLRASNVGFAKWPRAHRPRRGAQWKSLFARTFKFKGGRITGEFLLSTACLGGAHRPGRPVCARIAKTRPHGAEVSPTFRE